MSAKRVREKGRKQQQQRQQQQNGANENGKREMFVYIRNQSSLNFARLFLFSEVRPVVVKQKPIIT